MDRSRLSNIETGTNENPELTTLRSIATALQVDIAELFIEPRPEQKPDMDSQPKPPSNLIRFSPPYSKPQMLKCQLKTPGAVTSSRPSPSSTGPSVARIPERLMARLRTLDAEQLQVVEIVVVAIQRGVV
jgi:DNA-binding XRE family transcriptional regulator